MFCRWWSLVEKSWGIVQTYPQSLPFYSDFNQVSLSTLVSRDAMFLASFETSFSCFIIQGLGSHVSLQGQKLSDAPWYNISCQSLQVKLSLLTLDSVSSILVQHKSNLV